MIVLNLILVGALTITSYRSVPEQTDDSPYFTSIGDRTGIHGCAISPDLLCPLAIGQYKVHTRNMCTYKEKLHYGDWLQIDGVGIREINDVTHPKIHNTIDVWVETYAQEKAFGIQHRQVFLVEPTYVETARRNTQSYMELGR